MEWKNYNSSWINKHPKASLREKLRHVRVPDMSEFDLAMEKNPKLKKLLETPIMYLDSNSLGFNYRYFSDLPSFLNLYQTIQILLEDFFTRGEFFYSEYNGEIKGFVFYTLPGSSYPGLRKSEVSDIGVLSFNLDENNLVTTKDLYELFKKLMKEYEVINWYAFKDNPAVPFYKKIVEKYNGKYIEDPEDPECYKFTVPGEGRSLN